MNNYEVYIGCEEWQETTQFKTYREAFEYIDNHPKVMGLYPADEIWIENLKTGKIELIDE